MAAYIIAEVDLEDAAGYEAYRARVPAVIAAHGGRYLARGGATELLEGGGDPNRIVILEFPDMASLQRFYRSPQYQELIAIRQRASTARLIAVEGVQTPK